jgi:hypothetical protein
MMKILKTLSLVLMSVLVVILLFISATTFWIINNPQSAWNFASRYLFPDDLNIKWETMVFEWKKKSWTEWDMTWSTDKFGPC